MVIILARGERDKDTKSSEITYTTYYISIKPAIKIADSFSTKNYIKKSGVITNMMTICCKVSLLKPLIGCFRNTSYYDTPIKFTRSRNHPKVAAPAIPDKPTHPHHQKSSIVSFSDDRGKELLPGNAKKTAPII